MKLQETLKGLICEIASVIKTVHVSKLGRFGVTKIRASEHQLAALGYVVNADDLNNALNQVLETLHHVTLFRPEEIIKVEKIDKIPVYGFFKD